MLIDTHSHFGLVDTGDDMNVLLERARASGVVCGIITTGSVGDFEKVRETAHAIGWGYAVGIHPLFIHEAKDEDLETLSLFLELHQNDSHLVAVGEIGLDRYMEEPDNDRQERFFKAQLQLAQKYHLPVSVHFRRALFRVVDILKDFPDVKVALHAFAGSLDEAKNLAKLGYKMGFGGALTYAGSKRVRQAAIHLPIESLLLETDTPDMPPAFNAKGASEPSYLEQYLQELAIVRQEDREALEHQILQNTLNLFPKVQVLLKG